MKESDQESSTHIATKLLIIVSIPAALLLLFKSSAVEPIAKDPSVVVGEFAYWTAGDDKFGRLLTFPEDRSSPVAMVQGAVTRAGMTIIEAELPGCGKIRFTTDDLGSIYGAAELLTPAESPSCPVTSWAGAWRIGEIN